MWWLDPGKEVLNVVFKRILAPYVANLDMNQVNYGIGQGQLTLRNLRLKKGALDKFRLPVDVLEGHLGKFTLSLHWMNLGNKPVEIMIEDVYLLVVPSPQTTVDPKEDEERAQAAKAERLENSELLHMRDRTVTATENFQENQGLFQSLITKIINNFQITVRRIHIRYEDHLSVPGRPFAAGATLAGFTAVSVNDQWQPAFIESTAGTIRKLANLESLAVYFDTDSRIIAGLASDDVIKALMSNEGQIDEHQYILRPVSGEGRITVNHSFGKDTPRFDVQGLFDEIGVALNHDQYKDVISLVDMYHVYARKLQYRKFRPSEEEFSAHRAKAWLKFASTAILEGVRERRRKWAWEYFRERRDDRRTYVDLFQRKLLGTLVGEGLPTFEQLERKLSYEDLRFYRSLARSQLRKDAALRKRLDEERAKQQAQTSGGWTSWLWGSSQKQPQAETAFGGEMTDQQRKELYDALDYDEKAAIVESINVPRDALKARIAVSLNRGSFALKMEPSSDALSIVFDVFQATFVQRPDNFEASLSLADFSVFDRITPNTLHPKIVQVKEASFRSPTVVSQATDEKPASHMDRPFFYLNFEMKPLDDRADTALTVCMREMEIIYHKGVVETVYWFFKPPASQLESVEALLSAASRTLEGLRKETRAGLEFALQNHKTVDVQMDMNAPIIIIPEDITTSKCKHLVIDAGHISIESDLANKSAVHDIYSKRNQKYGEEDYERLEALMYDKMFLKFEAAQFLIGNDLQSCRDALASDSHDTLHLLERVNIEVQIQNSIVPKAVNLTRFKISGTLPTLQLNMSDINYLSLMRIIDVCVPNFDNDEDTSHVTMVAAQLTNPVGNALVGYTLPPLLAPGDSDYKYIEAISEDQEDNTSNRQKGVSHDAEDAGIEHMEWHQHLFELNFEVEKLRVSVSKANGDMNKPLGDLVLERFSLALWLAKFDMHVDVKLRSLSMQLIQPGVEPIEFASSVSPKIQADKDLLTVAYKRVQKTSPEFITLYDGISQSVDVNISTFIFRIAPEPVLALYDFVMTTFVPHNSAANDTQTSQSNDANLLTVATQAQPKDDKIRVTVQLATVQVTLVNAATDLATLSLTTAQVEVLLRANALRVAGRLGSLNLSDDSKTQSTVPEFKQILSIEGDNFAVFRYETYDADQRGPDNIQSFFTLDAASVKVHFLERPLHSINLFMAKLAKLKGLYDAAAQAAVQKASAIERMRIEVSVKSPIVIFPSNASKSLDVLILRLGEISARNHYEGVVNKIEAGLRGIHLASKIYHDYQSFELNLIDDIDVEAHITHTNEIDRAKNADLPDSQVVVGISDVKLHLTQVQYGLLIALSESVPRAFKSDSPDAAEAEAVSPLPSKSTHSQEVLVDLEPELRTVPSSDGVQSWPSLDLLVTINVVKLHLYDASAMVETNLKDHGIARFALNTCELRLKTLSDGASEAQVVLKSFTMSNIRPTSTQFREIIPAADHDRNQFMLLYTNSGPSSLLILTVDSPQIMFAVDPMLALLGFFTSASPSRAEGGRDTAVMQDNSRNDLSTSPLDFRVDLHDVAISILENDMDAESPVLKLSISQILLAQQGTMVLTVSQFGMSLTRMGKQSESVRVMDDVNLSFSLDNRTPSSQNIVSVEIAATPLIFRASYRDISLIAGIINKASQSYMDSQKSQSGGASEKSNSIAGESSSQVTKPSPSKVSGVSAEPVGHARMLISKEQLRASMDGFQLILIGDMHEQPMLHLKTKPFILEAKDWSGELQATTTIASSINYWNLTNSHWEPLIDPWTFTVSVARDDLAGGLKAILSARERLDLNISTTFAELVMTTTSMWGKEYHRALQTARGSYAPYKIRNCTGSPLLIWPDVDGSQATKDARAIRLDHDQVFDWRFDDWRTMREHVSSASQHTLGLQFIGKPWESLRGIPVHRECVYTFSLRPVLAKYRSRLLCEVKLENNVKIVTFRSAYKIENQTLYPLELTLVDGSGQPVCSLIKLAPGQDYSLPVESVNQHRVRLKPDQGFGYKWCSPFSWEDLLVRPSFTIKCAHTDPRETEFRFQAWVESDLNEGIPRKSPKINLKLRAPIELENLLPHNLRYRIYDKNTDQNWRSYLRTGGLMPIHSVELGHLVLLSVEIQDTAFSDSDFAIINTDGHSDFDIEKRLAFREVNERKLNLQLNYVRYPDSGGAFKVQIYSPYLVVNKTSLPFSMSSSRPMRANQQVLLVGDVQTDVSSKPLPFLLSHANDTGHEFRIKIGDSAWSKNVNFEAPAADFGLVIPSQRRREEEIHLGLSWTEGLGKFKLTKIITLAPRFLLKNNLSQTLCFRQHGDVPRERSTIEPNERYALYYIKSGQEKLLKIAFPGLVAQWSAPINIEDIGSVHLRLRDAVLPGTPQLVRTDVKINGPTIFVSFSRADVWPFRIKNDSDYDVTFCQESKGDSMAQSTPVSYKLKARSSVEYAWDFPAAREKKILLAINGARRVVDIFEIGSLPPFKFRNNNVTRIVSLDVRADGHQQVLGIAKYEAKTSIYKPGRAQPDRRFSVMSGSELFEAVTEDVKQNFSLRLELAGIGISLMNRKVIEVIYVTISTLRLDYTDSTISQEVSLSCGSLQVDNQLHDAIYPVILQPTPINSESKGVAPLPTIQASLVWLKDQDHGVLFIKYCSILLQALTIEVDEDLLLAVYDLTQIKGASWDEEVEDLSIDQIEITEPHDTVADGQDLYFELLELQPMQFTVSFMRTERISSGDKLSIRNPFAVVVNALTMAVGNINEATLELNALGIKDMRLTVPELQQRITYHYRQDVLRQLYRILGSADFIGNPIGLFTNVSSGVADIFYEPFNGVVMHGNKELGIGIAKGAASFVKKTVFGFSDSVTKVTGSVSKGLSAATFDQEYQDRRRITQRRNRPRHAIYGVTAGGEAFASSLASAVEGIVTKPIEGAETEGALGFFSGVGRGLVGLVTKPVVGVFDLASNVAEGIRNTTTVFDTPRRDRVRLPRHTPADGILKPYSEREATGQYWLKDLENGSYRNELYEAHIASPGGDNVTLLTQSRILSFWSNKLKLEWDLSFTQIKGVSVEDTGIRLAHRSGPQQDRFILITDKSTQAWFFSRVAAVVKSFNARRHMDS